MTNKGPIEYLFDSSGNEFKGGVTVYELEKNVFNSLNDLNKKYVEYINSEKTDNTKITDSITDLNQKISALNTAVTTLKTKNIDTNINTIDLINTYKDIIDKRNDLDIKMMEINKSIDSNYIEQKGKNDSTKYTNILITVLATSLIYYIFVKL